MGRFASQKAAISYCGLCGAEQSSAGKLQRTPISKQRNKHLQTTLIEAAKVAPRCIRSSHCCMTNKSKKATTTEPRWPSHGSWFPIY